MNAHSPMKPPRKAAIKRLVAAAREAGIDVGGFEVSPDGTIRILQASPQGGGGAYDRWKEGA